MTTEIPGGKQNPENALIESIQIAVDSGVPANKIHTVGTMLGSMSSSEIFKAEALAKRDNVTKATVDSTPPVDVEA